MIFARLALLLLAPALLAMAADAPPPAHYEKITLADGRVLIGVVDESSSHIALCDEKTGKSIATLAIDAKAITAREDIAITPPAASDQPERIPGSDGKWVINYKQALESAQKSKRPVLAFFTGSDWCPWCKKLQAEVFTTREFKAWAAEHVVLALFDYPRTFALSPGLTRQNRDLAEKYGITGYPHVIAFDATGTVLGVNVTYMEGGVQKFIPEFERRCLGQRPPP
jgi:thioredoxin-related protein